MTYSDAMNKTILVPTDFSVFSHSALQYACGMALRFGHDIHLIHAFQPLVSKFAEDTFNQEITENAEAKCFDQLTKLISDMQVLHPDLTITGDCLQGEVSDVLMSIGGKSNYKLIVMGTKGANAMKDRIMGTNTYNAILKSPIPIFAIPDDFKGFSLNKAGLLTNFKNTDLELLDTFTALFDRNIPITLLHIRETNSQQEEIELYEWRDHLRAKTGVDQIECKIDTISKRLDVNDNIPESIHDLAEEAGLDALLITHNSKSFFKKIFSRNLVKNIAHQIHRPVFFYTT